MKRKSDSKNCNFHSMEGKFDLFKIFNIVHSWII
jgi:hypothetical protein